MNSATAITRDRVSHQIAAGVADAVAQTERALLSSVLLNNSLWSHTVSLTVNDFVLESHREIYGQMAHMIAEGRTVDSYLLAEELAKANKLDRCGGTAYLGVLFGGEPAVEANVPAYVRQISEAARERQYDRLCERLVDATETEARIEIVRQMQDVLTQHTDRQNGRALFHTYDEFINQPDVAFAIDGFLQEGCATAIAALPGHGKTWLMLAIARSLLTGEPLFDYFVVPQRSKRVLYLIPESTSGPFWKRIKLLHLEEFVRNEQLLVHTLSIKNMNGKLKLNDSRLLGIADGCDFFIDTASRFMTGGEDIEDARELGDAHFGLLSAGARTITTAHHSPKAFETAKYMCLENVMRGSGDLGASFAIVWGMRQIDPVKNRVYVQNVKPRDFEPCPQFVLEGRPHIDLTACFEMLHCPGEARDMAAYVDTKGGRPELPEKNEKIAEARRLKDQNMSYRDISDALGVTVPTLHRWLNPKQ